jgi:ubiquitin-conjugating enzyme E2 variant
MVSGIFFTAAALLLVDFVSGLVHWAEDTFGTESTPLVGRWIVAPNVLHHRDAEAFVDRHWLASSWDLGLLGVILGWLGPAVFVFALAGGSANQIHKWNHAPSRAPRAVRVLWRVGLLQRPAHHNRHHGGEKNTAYCVITPFVNPLLDRAGFWRRLERAIVPFTGAPRREDLRALHALSQRRARLRRRAIEIRRRAWRDAFAR